MNFALFFNQYTSVLEKHKRQLSTFQFDSEAINQIKKTLYIGSESITYTFSTIKFVIPKKHLPSHTIPRGVGNIEIILKIEDDIVIKKQRGGHIEDPLVKLEKFNIILNSEDWYTSSWHLDRHEKQTGEKESKNTHPIYHLTFGGYHMENEQIDDEDVFGRSLIIRAPRLMHPPMELILGVDFIFNHFIPKDELELLSDPSYISLIKGLKKYLWMPFALAFAKNFCNTIDIDRESYSFDEVFVKSVIGH